MMTVHEVSKIAGVSARTLQYYDRIGLLHPSAYTEAGYRLYSEKDMERLQQILLFRELEFPLQDIRNIMDNPDYDQRKALEQQITLLELKKEHLENLINFARGIKLLGVNYMDFSAFDRSKLDEYAKQAKDTWKDTAEYKEFEEKSKGRTADDEQKLSVDIMQIFAEFGAIRDTDPASNEAQALVVRLQKFITANFYNCSDKILSGLGKMYSGGGDFTANIDEVGGEGTAVFADRAIQIYCNR